MNWTCLKRFSGSVLRYSEKMEPIFIVVTGPQQTKPTFVTTKNKIVFLTVFQHKILRRSNKILYAEWTKIAQRQAIMINVDPLFLTSTVTFLRWGSKGQCFVCLLVVGLIFVMKKKLFRKKKPKNNLEERYNLCSLCWWYSTALLFCTVQCRI